MAQTRFLFLQCLKMNLESSKVAAGPKKSHFVSDETKKLLQGKNNDTYFGFLFKIQVSKLIVYIVIQPWWPGVLIRQPCIQQKER